MNLKPLEPLHFPLGPRDFNRFSYLLRLNMIKILKETKLKLSL